MHCKKKKIKKDMTQAELDFLTRTPRLLNAMVDELKKLNENIKKLTEKVENLED